VANRAYRAKEPVLHECASSVSQPKYSPKYSVRGECTADDKIKYSLAFVEFDDVGEMFGKRSKPTASIGKKGDDTAGKDDHKIELEQAIAEIEEINRDETAKPVFVVFIHGWHNNASESSGNVWGFRSELRQLVVELNQPGEPPRPVMGIYIGWRGEATNLPVAKDFSFWNRKDAATRIPGAHLTEAVRRITMAAKSNPRARCVVVGHSFGGLVLERTLTQAMVEMILEYKEDTDRIERELANGKDRKDKKIAEREKQDVEDRLQARRPDLTVLLNEAGPATSAKEFMTFLQDEDMEFVEEKNAKKVNYPLFLSLTSSGDSATHILFPVGQFLGKHGLNTRKYKEKGGDEFGETDQNNYFLHTTANSARLVTHTVTPHTSAPAECPGNFPTVDLGNDNGKTKYYICQRASLNDTPYWAMQIPTEFVPDHSTVFRPELRALLRAFVGPLVGTARGRGEGEATETPAPKALKLRRKPVEQPTLKGTDK
jgi:hypothetical protein